MRKQDCLAFQTLRSLTKQSSWHNRLAIAWFISGANTTSMEVEVVFGPEVNHAMANRLCQAKLFLLNMLGYPTI